MCNPIRGQTRKLSTVVNTDVNANIHNRFDVEVIDVKTGTVKQKAVAYNTICNQLWTRLLTPNTYFNYIHYGTGTGTPASTDTSLFTFLGYESNFLSTDFDFDYKSSVYSCQRKVQLVAETAVGAEITEVGIAYGTSSGNLCTHAMLKDMNGNQISISKTSTDVINIYATIFVHLPMSETSPSVWFPTWLCTNPTAGISSKISYFWSWMFGIYYDSTYSKISRNSFGPGTNVPATYNAAFLYKSLTPTFNALQKSITLAATRLGVNDQNYSSGLLGTSFFTYEPRCSCSMAFVVDARGSWWGGSTISGEAVGTGDGTTTDFSTKFSLPQGATIYVDGVATQATVDCVPLLYNDMGQYFVPIAFSSYSYNDVIINVSTFGMSNTTRDADSSIFYNPFYNLGIKSVFSFGNLTVFLSNDMDNWEQITTTEIPSEYRKYKYWKLIRPKGATVSNLSGLTAENLTGKNIHFASPPASGAAITADYTTKVIAKDANHVFDLTVTIQLGEYTS